MTPRARRRRSTRARAELDELPDVGALGALYDETDGALHRRARRDGFLGEELSDAELRILELLAAGRSISEVAHELWLSSNTVKSHRRSIYRKLGVHTREAMLQVISELGIGKASARCSPRVIDAGSVGATANPF